MKLGGWRSQDSGIIGRFRMSLGWCSTQIQILLSTPGSPSADSSWACRRSESVSVNERITPCCPDLVGWQVQLVEAGVCRGQPVCRPVVLVDLELLGAVHPLQGGEALQRDLGRTSHELEELGLVRRVERTQGAPEPHNLQKAGHVLGTCMKLIQ